MRFELRLTGHLENFEFLANRSSDFIELGIEHAAVVGASVVMATIIGVSGASVTASSDAAVASAQAAPSGAHAAAYAGSGSAPWPASVSVVSPAIGRVGAPSLRVGLASLISGSPSPSAAAALSWPPAAKAVEVPVST